MIVNVRIRFFNDNDVSTLFRLAKPEKVFGKSTGRVLNYQNKIIGYYDLFED